MSSYEEIALTPTGAQRSEQDDAARGHRSDSPSIPPAASGTDAVPAARYEHLAAELDDVAEVPTEVLADWVAARGQCLWETTFGDPPDWFAEKDPDRELATRAVRWLPGARGVPGVRAPRGR